MKRKILVTIVIALLIVTLDPCGLFDKKKDNISRRKKIKLLDKKYRDWLDLSEYIITTEEKKIFFKLTNNRDRDAFIKLFWK